MRGKEKRSMIKLQNKYVRDRGIFICILIILVIIGAIYVNFF